LRGVLRQIDIILEEALKEPEAPANMVRLLGQGRAAARTALKRRRTNGHVIDTLERENGDLQSDIIDLKVDLRRLREKMVRMQEGRENGE
jgi:hypothetical protein